MSVEDKNGVSVPVNEAGGDSDLSAEAKLRQLQEKTDAWKKSAALQLNDAAKKNRQLRDELKVASMTHETEMAALRVQLDKEFRERTSMKDEEISTLQTQLAGLREEKRQMAEQHEKDLRETTTRVRESCVTENNVRTETEVQQLRNVIEKREKELLWAEHELAVMTARLERLGEQYRELSTLVTQNSEQVAAGENVLNGETPFQHALKMSDGAHQQQLEAARLELRNLEEKNLEKLREAQRMHEVERQRWENELYQRDEQLATLQALLRQAQHDVAVAQQRIAGVRVEKEQSEQRLFEKVAGLSKELASRIEQGEALSFEVERLQREVSRRGALVDSLEEEAQMREEAFASLMLSEESRALVQGLQAALEESREETENWRCKYEEALLDTRRAAVVALQQDSEVSGDAFSALNDLAKREEALVAEAARLELKAKLLKTTEIRLEEIKQSVASQASAILQQRNAAAAGGGGGGDDDGSGIISRRRDVDGSWTGRGASLLSGSRLYMQMVRERHDGAGLIRRLLSLLFYFRMRTALPILLLTLSLFVMLIGFRAVAPRDIKSVQREAW